MPKHKKTREQKILADKRLEINIKSLMGQEKPSIVQIKQTVATTTSSYKYLTVDLTKTAIFTGFIVLVELSLRYFIKN